MIQAVDTATGLACAMPVQTVLCLGNFDGVHLGHQALIAAAKQMRDERFPAAALGIFCFRGLSSDWLAQEPPGHLTGEADRLAYFRAAGAEVAVLADFPALRDTAPADFVRDILIRSCHCVAAACGFNHRFGRMGQGTPALLGELLGGRVLVCPAVLAGGEPISSTRVRHLLLDGQPDAAAALLGHPFALTAAVTHGAQLGRTIGIPTINQRFPALALIPKTGVYYTVCTVGSAEYAGVTDVGTRPTVDGAHEVRCETNLLDFSGDLYGATVKTSFLRYLRPEKKFASVDALRAQIEHDRSVVRALWEQAGNA